jgi:hypothetical protein
MQEVTIYQDQGEQGLTIAQDVTQVDAAVPGNVVA